MYRPRPGYPAVGSHGFTLIELMVAVAVLGIMAAIAVPSYTSYMKKSRLTEAPPLLLTMSARMERTFLDTRAYDCPDNNAQGERFTVTCRSNANSYTLTASSRDDVGLGNRADAYAFTLNNQGQRATTAFPNTRGARACWLMDESGDCF